MATTTLFLNGSIRSPEGPSATAMVVRDGSIAWVGNDPEPVREAADHVVDLEAALVTPAFVDAHVHSTSTGLAIEGLDLTGATSLADCLDRVASAARRGRGRVLLGHGWDQTDWPEGRPPTRHELDRATYGGVVYLSRVDVHSAVVSSALLAAVPEVRGEVGWDESGHVTREAHHVVRRVARESISADQRRSLQRATRRRAAELGIGCFHELAGPDISSEEDLVALLELVREEEGPDLVAYWGELGQNGVSTALRLAAAGAAGDLFADGSIGSHTAALRTPYADADHSGSAYLREDEVRDHVVACTAAGLQAGFHAIGDAALDIVTAGLAAAAKHVGVEAIRRAHHRVEHAEMLSPEAMGVMARLGVVASVQPAFDRLWGGGSGMYAQRLGADRGGSLNPFADMARAGVVLALGSDSPVTPLDPWGSVRAAVAHRTPGSGLSTEAAFEAHTRGGWLAAGEVGREHGVIGVGSPATFAVWDRSGPDLPGAEEETPLCRQTVVRGRTIYSAG